MSSFGAFTKFLGPRYYQMARNWSMTAGAFGGTAACIGLYITDWKAVLRFLPYYGSKYPVEPPK